MASMLSLSDKILSHLLSYVPFYKSNWLNVILVCKRFRTVAKKAFDPSVNGNYAVQWASSNGIVALVEELMKDERVDPSAKMSKALQLACKGNHKDAAKALLRDARVDPSCGGNCAIFMVE
jgi:hypothetical protein